MHCCLGGYPIHTARGLLFPFVVVLKEMEQELRTYFFDSVAVGSLCKDLAAPLFDEFFGIKKLITNEIGHDMESLVI